MRSRQTRRASLVDAAPAEGSWTACTIAASRPASAHSWRKTLLSTWRAAGLRPKEMLESPRIVRTPGSSRLDAPDRLDRLDAVAARLDHARRQRQRQRVDEDVLGRQPVARDGEVGDARGAARTFQSAVRAWPSSSMQVATTAAPNSAARRQEPVEARAGSVALFEVDRVEDGLAAEPGERGARDLGLGGVDHDRHRGLRGQAAHQLVHVARRRRRRCSRRTRRGCGRPP